MRCAWVIYGSLEQPTGGYVYDRLVVAGLRGGGHVVDVMDVARPDAVERVLRDIRDSAYDCVVGDELCHPELASVFQALHADRDASRMPKLVLLVHHLNASETGSMLESERRVLEHCDRVITTSHTTARQVLHWSNLSAIVCLPGADRLPRLPRANDGELRLSFVGTWTQRKGLLRVFEYLLHLHDVKFRFDVVGDATREPTYALAIAELLESEPWLKQRTHVHGVLADAALAAIYARSNVLVLPSSYEGYGMVLTEALHAGVPVIVSDVGATSEVVRHDVDGLLLASVDTEHWVHVLRQLANDPTMLERWSNQARELPTWEATVAGFARALQEA
jgi:glycosyltransferase involved in cell wall biosynthesis